MKNTIKIIGIIAFAAIIGFVMISCKEDAVDTDLQGTWKPESGDVFVSNLVKQIQFTADKIIITYKDNTSDEFSSSTSGTSVTITDGEDSLTYTYRVENGKLTLAGGEDTFLRGVYIKG
jgi:hypothetical protein